MNPEIPLPESFKQGIFEAFNTNKTGYISPSGIERLRKAISSDLQKNFQIDAHADNVLVIDGPKGNLIKQILLAN
jgi:aspartate/methionine/tyrosine aminotransferase